MILKSFLIILPVLFNSNYVFSQECSVEKAELKGVYTGDCKKGKANGKGKAVGTDTYEGDFKSGLPDGEGIYTFKNGNVYKGHFSKGLLDGKGTFAYKRENTSDSIIDGYWRKNTYVGMYEHPYTILDKSSLVYEVFVKYNGGDDKQITFNVSNTSGGDPTYTNKAGLITNSPGKNDPTFTPSNPGESPKIKVDNILLMTGNYVRKTMTDSHSKATETILYQVTFPTRMKVLMGGEFIDIEFREPGSYTVDVHINK